MANKLTASQLSRFLSLANSLSPENLSCDGECSRAEQAERLRTITRSWQALEREVGFTVREDDVWAQYYEERAGQDRAASEANERHYGGTVD